MGREKISFRLDAHGEPLRGWCWSCYLRMGKSETTGEGDSGQADISSRGESIISRARARKGEVECDENEERGRQGPHITQVEVIITVVIHPSVSLCWSRFCGFMATEGGIEFVLRCQLFNSRYLNCQSPSLGIWGQCFFFLSWANLG